MKKQYIFLIMLLIILYLGYKILNSSYNKYIISSHIEYIQELNDELKNSIEKAYSLIGYKSSMPYIDLVVKEDLSRKNRGEKVVFFTNEQTYNKFVNETKESDEIEIDNIKKEEENINMTIFQKWIYIIFKKDLSL